MIEEQENIIWLNCPRCQTSTKLKYANQINKCPVCRNHCKKI